MRSTVSLGLAVLISIVLVAAAVAELRSTMDLTAGDAVYVCNCGEECQCHTMSNNPGKCTCGRDLIKAKITRVEGGIAYFMADGWEKERAMNIRGKYACACGPKCTCNAISQDAGKCTCGVEMKEVK